MIDLDRRDGLFVLRMQAGENRFNRASIDALHAALDEVEKADEPAPQSWHRHMGFAECGVISGLNEGIGEIFFVKDLHAASGRQLEDR